MVTGYEEADYHQTIGDQVEEHQGWLERWVANESGDGGTWVRLDPKVAATGFTGRQLIDRDGVTGNENDGTDVYAISAATISVEANEAASGEDDNGVITVTFSAQATIHHGEEGASSFIIGAQPSEITLTSGELAGSRDAGYSKLLVARTDGSLRLVDTGNAKTLDADTDFVLGTITYVVDGDNALTSASFVQADGIETANGIRFWE